MPQPHGGNFKWIKDEGAGDWIQLHEPDWGYPQVVRHLVPSRFEAYARLLHPFWAGAQGVLGRLRWAELASRNARPITPAMRVEDILLTSVREARSGGLTVGGGQMSPEDWEALGQILNRHTGSEAVALGFWQGHGTLPTAPLDALFSLPNRQYFIAEVRFSDWGSSEVALAMPNIGWPPDNSWFLNTDIGSCATYVGGTAELVGDLVESSQLEVMPAELDDPVFMY